MMISRLGLSAPLLLLLLFHSGIFVAESHLHRGHGHGRELQGLDLSRVASLTDEAGVWNGFKLLVGVQLGDVRTGLASLKSYLLQFGYIDPTQAPPTGTNFTDTFDNITKNAVTMYQQSFGLPVTGKLDVATLTQMIMPRCGREDVINGTLLMLQNGLSPNRTGTQHLGVQRYSTFEGNPRWRKQNLTYAIDESSLTPDVSITDIQIAIDSAFATWAATIPLTFTRIQSLQTADITVEFAAANHGDGYPFDGPLGVVAHGFAPVDGRLHFDLGDTWTVDVRKQTHPADMDLVSVAVHEIGHLLGLGHSNVTAAVMYPTVYALQEKRKLGTDDVAGAQALYGSNPLWSSDSGTSSAGSDLNAAVASWRRMRVADCVVVAVAASTALATLLTPASRLW